jgi:hypothetical protein
MAGATTQCVVAPRGVTTPEEVYLAVQVATAWLSDRVTRNAFGVGFAPGPVRRSRPEVGPGRLVAERRRARRPRLA